MLKGIPNIISPELLKILAEMGHGDEIVIADGNFPAETMGQRVIRADGHGACALLSAILSLIPLDRYADETFVLMETTNGDPTPEIWAEFEQLGKQDPAYRVRYESRMDFYARARQAYAVIATGESALYANVILKKGVI